MIGAEPDSGRKGRVDSESELEAPGGNDLARDIEDGMRHHRAGRLVEAEAAYVEALRREPGHSGALQLLALLKAQEGDWTSAIGLINRAIYCDPSAPVPWYNRANLLERSGRPRAAMDSYGEALRLAPDYVEARVNLGNLLRDRGRLDEAESQLRKALSIRPDFLFAHLNLGRVLEARCRREEARASYETALRLDPGSVEVRLTLGDSCLAVGDAHGANVHYGRAAELEPERSAPHNGMGNALLQLGRTREAEACYRRALDRAPRSAATRNNLGIALAERGRTDEAIDCYRSALELDPRLAEAHNNLGNTLQERGATAEAQACYLRALEIRPEYAEAHYNLSLVKTFEPGDPEIGALERLRDAMPESAEERRALTFALGKARADLGEHAKAFEAYAEGNRLRRSSFSFDGCRDEELFARSTSIFTEAFFAERSGFGFESSLPIFIVGMPRSGKTLLERLLRRHPALHAGGEPDLLPGLVATLPGRLGEPYPGCVARLTRDQACELGREYVFQAQEFAGSALRCTDTLPGNFLHVGLIHLLLPRAAILHCVRGAMDTCLRCYFTNFAKGQRFSFDLEELGRYYLSYRRLMRHWQQVLPGRVLEVRYEELVHDPRRVLTEVEAHCGLERSPVPLDEEKAGSDARGDDGRILGTALHDREIGRWRDYETQLEPLARILANRFPEG